MIPASMAAERRFIVWAYGPLESGTDKRKKLPHDWRDPSGRAIDANDEHYWTTFDDARRVQGVDGIGFVTRGRLDRVDLDGCRDEQTGALTPDAQRIVDELDS